MLDLSVIIVSYNTRDLLLKCLDSVLQSLQHSAAREPLLRRGYEVIVVDNGSADNSARAVAHYFPDVLLIVNEGNRGFAAANNQAIQESTGRYLLFLNPDTEVVGDAIATLLRFLERAPGAGVVTAKLLNADGSFQHSAFRFPTLWMTFLDFFPLSPRLLDSHLNGRYPRRAYYRPFLIDHPLGACMLVRRAVVERTGGFSEDYFMYGEEVDWCIRIKQDGWLVYCQPQAEVVHYGGQSTAQTPDRMYVELHRSRLRLFRRHYSPFFQVAARVLTGLGLWCEYSRWTQRYLRGEISRERFLGRRAALLEIARLLPHTHEPRGARGSGSRSPLSLGEG